MVEPNPLLYVTPYFTVKDMLVLGNTCKYMKQDEALWTFFYHEYRCRLELYEQYHLDNMKGIFYNDKK